MSRVKIKDFPVLEMVLNSIKGNSDTWEMYTSLVLVWESWANNETLDPVFPGNSEHWKLVYEYFKNNIMTTDEKSCVDCEDANNDLVRIYKSLGDAVFEKIINVEDEQG